MSNVTGQPQYGVLLISGNHTHQESYARAFAADSRCHLVGLVDERDVSEHRRELNNQLAVELGIPYFDDLDESLARDDVQIVSVCPEPERRSRLTIRCAQAGKHVYVDKPLTTSTEEAHAVADAVAAAGVRSQMFSLVRIPLAQQAREIVQSGQLGKLFGLHCELMFAKGIAGTADLSKPRDEKPQAPRFTFLDSKRELYCVGLYPLVLFQWLTGKRIESVNGATTSNYFFEQHQKNDVEDFSCLMLRMEDGIQATVTAGRTGWSSHPSHGVHQLHLVGTKGSVTIDAYAPRMEISSDAAPWKQPEVPHPEDPMGFWWSTQDAGGVQPKTDWCPIHQAAVSDTACFVDCLDADRESDVPASMGAHAVEVIMTAYRAAASESAVEIDSRR